MENEILDYYLMRKDEPITCVKFLKTGDEIPE